MYDVCAKFCSCGCSHVWQWDLYLYYIWLAGHLWLPRKYLIVTTVMSLHYWKMMKYNSLQLNLIIFYFPLYTHTHTHTHIYIYIYILCIPCKQFWSLKRYTDRAIFSANVHWWGKKHARDSEGPQHFLLFGLFNFLPNGYRYRYVTIVTNKRNQSWCLVVAN